MPFLDNDLVDFAMRVPVRLKLGNLAEVVRLNENEPGGKTQQYFRADARRQAAAAQGDGALHSRAVTDAREAGLLGAGRELVQGREHRLREAQAFWRQGRPHLRISRLASVKRLVDEHMSGTSNRRLLIWSLLSLESWCEAFG